MKNRQLIILGSAIAIVIAGYGGCSLLAGMKKAPERKNAEKTIRLVKTKTISNDTLVKKSPLNGKLIVQNKLEIYPEVTGTLVGGSHPFKVGQAFNAGEVLLQIDGSEAMMNLNAQRSAFINAVAQILPDVKLDYEDAFPVWLTFFNSLRAESTLPTLPEPQQEKLKQFLAARNIYQLYFNIKSLEERQSKFIITAPYNGVVSEGNLNVGTVLRAAQKAGTYIQNDAYELEAALPAADAMKVQVGQTVQLHFKGDKTLYTGKIVRVAANVDPMSQRVSVYASVEGKNLREGLYMEGSIALSEVSDAVKIDRSLLFDENKVFVVADSILQEKSVMVLDLQGEYALVKGLSNGDQLLDQFIEGAYVGMPVRIENKKI